MKQADQGWDAGGASPAPSPMPACPLAAPAALGEVRPLPRWDMAAALLKEGWEMPRPKWMNERPSSAPAMCVPQGF